MRGIWPLAAVVLLGCGVSREQYQAQVERTRRFELLAEQERDRADALKHELQTVLEATEALLADRAALTDRIAALETSLAEAEAARQELLEVNAALAGQRAKLSQLTEQISSTWYDSALDRARRALSEEQTAPPVAAPVEEPIP